MRQLIIHVPRGHGEAAASCAREHHGVNLARFEARGDDAPLDVLIAHVENHRVEGLLADLRALPDMHVTLTTGNVLALRPPHDEATEQVTDVGVRSPLEVVLNGRQSIGSWLGFLGYAAAAAAVVWIGLFTGTSYLLVAAMLIAPFAGPALNVALGSARGDLRLVRRGLLRYGAALALTVALAALLTLLLGPATPTAQMRAAGTVSAVALLLPLVAGAAGALTLMQAEYSSLVSGAAAGMLVAASLAPPAGLVGMASATGAWDLAWRGAFVLLLQLVGIQLAGALVFRWFGVSARGSYHGFGRRWPLPVFSLVALLLAGGLLWLQLRPPPALERGSLAQRAVAEANAALEASGLARSLRAEADFAATDRPGTAPLMVTLDAEALAEGSGATLAELEARLEERIRERLRNWSPEVAPFVTVNLFASPGEGAGP